MNLIQSAIIPHIGLSVIAFDPAILFFQVRECFAKAQTFYALA